MCLLTMQKLREELLSLFQVKTPYLPPPLHIFVAILCLRRNVKNVEEKTPNVKNVFSGPIQLVSNIL